MQYNTISVCEICPSNGFDTGETPLYSLGINLNNNVWGTEIFFEEI